jgi:hypothetical protein
MTPTDPMLAKIRKLLAKAEDPGITSAEAELFTAKATQLIATYGVDQAMLAHAHGDRAAIGSRRVVLDAPYAADKADLLATIAVRLRCACVRGNWGNDGRREVSVHVFGHESDLARVEMLFTSLLVQSTTALARVRVPAHEHKAAFRRSWMAGFRQAVSTRLLQAERRAEQSAEAQHAGGASTSLVLADRSARVDEAMHQAYPFLQRGRPRTLSGGGGASGYAAGKRADLGGARVGGRRAIRS